MLTLANLTSIALAAPIGFLVGLIVGLALSSSYRIVRTRELEALEREHERRDHDHDRGA